MKYFLFMYKQSPRRLFWRQHLHSCYYSAYGKIFKGNKIEEVCWMFVTLIRYIFPFKGMLEFAENGNRFKTNAFIWASFSYFIQWYVYINSSSIHIFFPSSQIPLLFTHVTHADVTIWQTLESSKMMIGKFIFSSALVFETCHQYEILQSSKKDMDNKEQKFCNRK